MKKLLPLLTILFFMLPSVSSAAGLTSQQAASLIAVVQSSPGTPASAFISLITSFSSITVNQATSLIAVVQTAPSVPADAFVNLLISFTDDTPVAQPTPTNQQTTQPVTPTLTQPTTPNSPAPIQTLAPTPNASAIKAADIGNQITTYLQTLNSQIAILNAKIAIEKNQTTASKTATCQKTSNGCVTTPTQPSYSVSLSVDLQALSQLTQRKNTLNTIYTKVQDYGSGGVPPSAEDIAYLASSPMGISW